MKKKISFLICIMILVFSFAGCGKLEEITSNSVTLKDDGTIEALLVESFDQGYYSEDELINMVTAEANEYNSAHGADKIKVGDHSLTDGTMSLELIFADVDTYNNYMPEKIYVGTITSCVNAGYDLNRSLVDAGKSEKTIGKSELADMGAKKVIIVNDALTVRTPSKVTYYSQGMEKIDNQTVGASVDGCYFVIYK